MAVGLVLWWLVPAHAEFFNPDALAVHGFASQGYFNTSGNNLFGDSRNGSVAFRELGLNASFRFHPRLQASLQVLSRRAGAQDDGNPELDFGLLDYTMYSDFENRAGIRLGRIKNPIGLYNLTRDVAATRPGILLPQSIYLDGIGLRDFALSVDGGYLYGEMRRDWGNLFLDLGASIPKDLDAVTRTAFFGGVRTEGDLEIRTGQVGRLLFERDEGRVRLGLTGFLVRTEYQPVAGDPLAAGEIDVGSIILSAELDELRWTLTAEHAWRWVDRSGFDAPAVPDLDLLQQGFYLQGTYRITPRLEGFLRYDAVFNDIDDRGGRRQAEATGFPRHRFFARDFAIGVGWRPEPAWLLRAEYHAVDGSFWAPFQDNPALLEGRGDRHWDILALQLSFQF